MNAEPIVLKKVQMQLAMELAAEQAARREYAKQIGDQVGRWVHVIEVPINLEVKVWPEFEVEGRPILWQ